MTVLETLSDTDRYSLQVRAACEDLPPSAREELLEDLDEHLADVAAELEEGETLADRLGDPEAYASDLRQSAGYPPAPSPGSIRRRFGQGRAASRVRSLWEESESHPQGSMVRRYLTDLRPAWWLVRAYALVAGLAAITSSDGFNVVPHLFGSSAIGLVAVVGASWWSIRLGRATQPDQAPVDRQRRMALFANVAAGLCLLVVLAQVDDVRTVHDTVDYGYGDESYQPGALTSADGRTIENVYAFSSDGKALDGVLLYDQDGRPIDATEIWDADGNQLTPVFPKSAGGTEIKNRYPTEYRVMDQVGRQITAPSRPNLAVPVIPEAATTTTAPAKATTTTAAPKPTTTIPATTTTPPTTVPAKAGN